MLGEQLPSISINYIKQMPFIVHVRIPNGFFNLITFTQVDTVLNSLLADLFWLYVSDYYFKDDCLHHIAYHKHIAVICYIRTIFW